MPAEAEPIGSCGGAPGNEPAYPRPGAPAHETGPTLTDADGVIQLVTSEKCSRLGLCKLQNVALLICDIKNFTTFFERQY